MGSRSPDHCDALVGCRIVHPINEAGGVKPEEETLVELLASSHWHRRALEIVAATGVPDAWIAAGAIRDLVWAERFGGGFEPSQVKDIDVVFFDPTDLSPRRDADVDRTLRHLGPDLPWEAKNQAAVHRWYEHRFGIEVEPLVSIEDAVGTFPETATAVAARLHDQNIEIIAPLGLGDLLEGVWRYNPRRVSIDEARRRLERKQPARRWPGVTVVKP
jgi:hypothetical protein